MTLSPQWLDQLRERTTLSTLVQRTVPLKRKGSEWSACCPFHSENSPSFYVNDEKAFYHCFGCGAHGDAIRWLTDNGGLDFIDAVKELAAAAGMDMPDRDPRQADRDRELDEGREIMRRADGWFRDNIRTAVTAIDYLTSRGITKDVADEFGIGWAGSSDHSLKKLMAAVAPEKMVDVGLLKKREEDGEIYDFFRQRIMFPIHDARGRVIGFGGRALGDAKPKYLNSPDTKLFDKGRSLFNLHRAAQAARKANRLVIVEGYMDVIAFYRAGVTETVAPNGTALTEAQLDIAWKLADVPILCMDGDKAGKAAMARAAIKALPLLVPGKSLSFVTPAAGQDPDDILREGGAEAVQALLVKPWPLSAVLWGHERDASPCETPEEIAGFKARMRAHIRTIKDPDVRQAYGQDIAKRFRETFDAVAEGVIRSSPLPGTEPRRQWKKPAEASQEQKRIRNAGVGADIERAVLAGLVRLPSVAAGEVCAKARFQNPRVAEVVNVLIEIVWQDPEISEEMLRGAIADRGLGPQLHDLTVAVPPFAFTRKIRPDHRAAAEVLLTDFLKSLAC